MIRFGVRTSEYKYPMPTVRPLPRIYTGEGAELLYYVQHLLERNLSDGEVAIIKALVQR